MRHEREMAATKTMEGGGEQREQLVPTVFLLVPHRVLALGVAHDRSLTLNTKKLCGGSWCDTIEVCASTRQAERGVWRDGR